MKRFALIPAVLAFYAALFAPYPWPGWACQPIERALEMAAEPGTFSDPGVLTPYAERAHC